MEIKSIIPMIYTENLEETVNFYQDVLQFSCTGYKAEDGWANMKKDHVNFMIAEHKEKEIMGGTQFTGSFYFACESITEFWEELKNKVKVVYPLEDYEYGMKEFAILDNNGYMLQFGENNSSSDEKPS